jgi:site-specific DNA-methyltransferase (adenine-specific)
MNIDTKVYRKHESPTFGNTLLGAVPLVSEVYLMDNIELMKHYPDKYFDLAVVDPPYGIKADRLTRTKGKSGKSKTFNQNLKYNYEPKEWDAEIPNIEYWNELFRVSKNQIVWGGNYFSEYLPSKKGWIVWDKKVTNANNTNFSDCELAWTSFDCILRKFTYDWIGFGYLNNPMKQVKIHPTEKPITLYEWIFSQYSKEGDIILDTHLGSGSSRIAANKAKLNFVGCEIDEEYFNKQNKRYEEFVSQARLF